MMRMRMICSDHHHHSYSCMVVLWTGKLSQLLLLFILLLCFQFNGVSSWSFSTTQQQQQKSNFQRPSLKTPTFGITTSSSRRRRNIVSSPTGITYLTLLNSNNDNDNDDILIQQQQQQQQQEQEEEGLETMIKAQVRATLGLSETELPIILEAIHDGYQNGLNIPNIHVECIETTTKKTTTTTTDTTTTTTPSSTTTTTKVLGTLGRVLVLYTNLDDETIEILQNAISEEIDQRLYATPPLLQQPIFISIQNNLPETLPRSPLELSYLINDQVEMYGLIEPIGSSSGSSSDSDDEDDTATTTTTPTDTCLSYQPPTLNVFLDGANTRDEFHDTTFWDTSNILVFDNLISDSLRHRLLNVVLGENDDDDDNDKMINWDDSTTNGLPNPNRWIRESRLVSISSDNTNNIDGGDDDDNKLFTTTTSSSSSSCWGLSEEEFMEDLCNQRHDAIDEFETRILSQILFPQFVVTRIPEAVFGGASVVPPLTATAVVLNNDNDNEDDEEEDLDYDDDYYIDGDPNLAPPSPWTDIFGRYPNRLQGKPRFMSCIVYLNNNDNDEEEETLEDGTGAAIQFLDPPTNETYTVFPKAGRIVLVDQDCRRRTIVVVPSNDGNSSDSDGSDNGNAVKKQTRSQYSLTWRLILHPKYENQDMMDLSNGRDDWPLPIIIGSAQKK